MSTMTASRSGSCRLCTLCRWASSRAKMVDNSNVPHPKCLGSQKNPGTEPKTCEKGPKLGFEYLPTSKTSHCVRTACMAFPKCTGWKLIILSRHNFSPFGKKVLAAPPPPHPPRPAPHCPGTRKMYRMGRTNNSQPVHFFKSWNNVPAGPPYIFPNLEKIFQLPTIDAQPVQFPKFRVAQGRAGRGGRYIFPKFERNVQAENY